MSEGDASFKTKLESAQKALVKEGEVITVGHLIIHTFTHYHIKELYVTTNMIRNYLTLNLTGFGKILKKFDKGNR